MITSENEYLQHIVNSYNPPNILIRIPAYEPIYDIDLNTRTVSSPTFLGVEADHEAEILFFLMDRYYDNVDLSECIGVIQFKNAKNEEYMYVIPAYDINSYPNKILMAWNIQSPITKYSGTVYYAFKFFKMDKTSGELLYEINTMTAKSKVLTGWAKTGAKHDYRAYTAEYILSDPGIEPVLNEDGNPVGVDPTQPISEDNPPAYRVTGYGIWSKILDVYEANKNFAVYWTDV